MSCLTGLVNSVFFVRWKAPELADLKLIQDGVSAGHAELGKPLVYIAIIPEDCEPPPTAVRNAMMSGMDALFEKCSVLHFVIEGSGFKHSMLRSALTGILLVTGKKGRTAVHTSVDEALALAAKALKVDVASLARSARARQFIP